MDLRQQTVKPDLVPISPDTQIVVASRLFHVRISLILMVFFNDDDFLAGSNGLEMFKQEIKSSKLDHEVET